MKKYAGMLLAAALLCGCNSNNTTNVDTPESETVLSLTEASETSAAITETEAVSETVTETETAAETVTETDSAEPEYLPDEEAIISFLSYLQNGGDEWGYRATYVSRYDFLNDFKLDSYSYEHRGDGIYDITLTCSESTCEMFPDGDSCWYANTNWYGNFIFCPAEKESQIRSYDDMINAEEPLKTAYFAACDFSSYTDEFEADEEWFENYTNANANNFYHAHNFYHAYNPYMEKDYYDGVTVEEQIRATKQLYNITIPESAFDDVLKSEDGKVFPACGHGGSWYYDNFVGYEETDSEIKVRVDYYGDEIYFYPVIESEYTFSKNEDGTITLQKVEKIFDRGYKPARGSV